MKCICFIIVLLLGCVIFLNAQDLIIFRDGNTIEALVVEISTTEIRYKRFNHLDGPTIVIPIANVLSIRYENGTTEIFNASSQPTSIQENTQFNNHARLNTLGLSMGYLGVSNFGGIFNWNISPSQYTFFNLNMGVGFSKFSFSGNASFNAFVPFNIGGWYGGLGLGGGMYQLIDSMNGYFAVSAVTGIKLFDWLNISATLQMEVIPEFDIRFQPMIGYVYRFGVQESNVVEKEEKQIREPKGLQERKNWFFISLGYDGHLVENHSLGGSFGYERNLSKRFSFSDWKCRYFFWRLFYNTTFIP